MVILNLFIPNYMVLKHTEQTLTKLKEVKVTKLKAVKFARKYMSPSKRVMSRLYKDIRNS